MIEDADFFAPRRCCLDPIPELFEAARLLDEAADAHLASEPVRAGTLIAEADMVAIFDWSETLFTGATIPTEAKRIAIRQRPDPNKPDSVKNRAKDNIPIAVQREVIGRDGYVCRYCGIPVIFQKAQASLQIAYPNELRWGRGNRDKHTAFQALDLDLDHVVPRSLGGQNTCENLVVACSPCNSAKYWYTLAEIGLLDPRETEPEPYSGLPEWDGLTRLL
ncbi:MAG: HNH endonuclease [Alphaproteobacteria bacterium]